MQIDSSILSMSQAFYAMVKFLRMTQISYV